jgi:hypothetical protein
LDIHEKGEKENVVAILHELQAALRQHLASVEHSTDPAAPLFVGVKFKGSRLGRLLSPKRYATNAREECAKNRNPCQYEYNAHV